MNRTVSAEESTISQDSDSPPKKKTGEIKKEALRPVKSLEPVAQDNYECSICLSWLKEPVVTKCGHRFCKICLEEWRTKKNSKCPLDDMNLSVDDIFPDNYTKREIENMRRSFPDQFEPPNQIFECRFSTISCDFKSSDPQEVENHMKNEYKEHIDMLLSSHLKSQYHTWEPSEKSPTETANKVTLFQQQTTRELINAMYERIVVLEQQNREQELKIAKLEQLETKRNGILVWKFEDFRKKFETMQLNPQTMYYSSECYTDPNGYKFCARINLSQKEKDCLSFHIHLMRSDNDYHLSWPFIGRIKITMINKDPTFNQTDILMSKPEIKAFHRPPEDISPRGFGFTEYAFINEIIKRGFIDNNDCLTIKIEMNIV
ncbi:CLUMA_CG002311, isoform A [Clunio marinus]|uniref:CLUMA_CG002311, isoform A n=1 Tax=Clunio marinus TaxID=568069 RepID=A0A1J1HKC8_9DIPT|nr:CLUMA_CG002311, isoform A [Clunio marinus]